MTGWFVLGFTPDDVVGGQQDGRLAAACTQAWRAAGRPADFHVLESTADGEHLFVWFVNDAAARVLDDHGVGWRQFVIRRTDAPSPTAHDPLFATRGEL